MKKRRKPYTIEEVKNYFLKHNITDKLSPSKKYDKIIGSTLLSIICICGKSGENKWFNYKQSKVGASGCTVCKNKRRSMNFGKYSKKSFDKKDFLKKAIIIHGNNFYNYDNYNLKQKTEEGEIICLLHGPFNVMSCKHLGRGGGGCFGCQGRQKLFKEDRFSIKNPKNFLDYLYTISNSHTIEDLKKNLDYSMLTKLDKKFIAFVIVNKTKGETREGPLSQYICEYIRKYIKLDIYCFELLKFHKVGKRGYFDDINKQIIAIKWLLNKTGKSIYKLTKKDFENNKLSGLLSGKYNNSIHKCMIKLGFCSEEDEFKFKLLKLNKKNFLSRVKYLDPNNYTKNINWVNFEYKGTDEVSVIECNKCGHSRKITPHCILNTLRKSPLGNTLCLSCNQTTQASQISIIFFKWLKNILPSKYLLEYVLEGGEYRLKKSLQNKPFDGVIKDLLGNIICVIEFNGDFWHRNPKKYMFNDEAKYIAEKNLNKKEKKIFKKYKYRNGHKFLKNTLHKEFYAIKECKYLGIWESEFLEIKEKCHTNREFINYLCKKKIWKNLFDCCY